MKTKTTPEQISEQLLKVHQTFLKTGRPGLDPQSLQTMTLAKAIQLFDADAEAEWVSKAEQAQRDFLATL
jgi:hypothetical protein